MSGRGFVGRLGKAMAILRDVREVVDTTVRLLLFRRVRPDLERLGPLYLGMGLLFAWVAGVGRYWDSPSATTWQHLGLGSVAYVFLMGLLLWAIVAPLRPKNWNYLSVVVFVALTSPPAFLYAIPVERFMNFSAASQVNAIFLLVVAAWRVILLILFLSRAAKLNEFEVFVCSFLPMTLIVTLLTSLNLEQAVFDLMAGLRPEQATVNDLAYLVLLMITSFSILTFIPLLLAYLYIIRRRHTRTPG
jgi:hypothetical protein